MATFQATQLYKECGRKLGEFETIVETISAKHPDKAPLIGDVTVHTGKDAGRTGRAISYRPASPGGDVGTYDVELEEPGTTRTVQLEASALRRLSPPGEELQEQEGDDEEEDEEAVAAGSDDDSEAEEPPVGLATQSADDERQAKILFGEGERS